MQELTFTAFDTETATNNRASICQIGFVVIENSKIIIEREYLIQPPNNEYLARNSCIHGIDANQTKNQPSFPTVWKDIKHFFINRKLVAHNASFDLSVLCSCLEFYGIDNTVLDCDCTYALTGLKLKSLAESFSINLNNHHNALSDARVCAQAYLKLRQGMMPERSLIMNCSDESPFSKHERLSGDVLKPDLNVTNKSNPFYSKKIVFTGVLQTMTRNEAACIIKKLGADIDTTITSKTDYVIIGKGAGPSKLKSIDTYNSQGSNIKIIDESTFAMMIE